MMPATSDLVCEWLKVKWCRTQVKNPISVFQITKKSEEFNSEAGGTLVSAWTDTWEGGSMVLEPP
jgi:hypothetical protein